MPNPKRRFSHAKQGKRRSQRKLTALDTSLCPKCEEVKLPHRVCLNCGYYGNREIVVVEEG